MKCVCNIMRWCYRLRFLLRFCYGYVDESVGWFLLEFKKQIPICVLFVESTRTFCQMNLVKLDRLYYLCVWVCVCVFV